MSTSRSKCVLLTLSAGLFALINGMCFADRQNRLLGGRDRVRGPGRSPGVLLSCARPEGLDLFAYFAPFQGIECWDRLVTHVLADRVLFSPDQTYLNPTPNVTWKWHWTVFIIYRGENKGRY